MFICVTFCKGCREEASSVLRSFVIIALVHRIKIPSHLFATSLQANQAQKSFIILKFNIVNYFLPKDTNPLGRPASQEDFQTGSDSVLALKGNDRQCDQSGDIGWNSQGRSANAMEAITLRVDTREADGHRMAPFFSASSSCFCCWWLDNPRRNAILPMLHEEYCTQSLYNITRIHGFLRFHGFKLMVYQKSFRSYSPSECHSSIGRSMCGGKCWTSQRNFMILKMIWAVVL